MAIELMITLVIIVEVNSFGGYGIPAPIETLMKTGRFS